MNPIEKLIAMAGSQVGYLEKSKAAVQADPSVLDDFKRGAGMDNYTKYARDQWKVKYFNSSKQGVAWCAVFVGWCFLQCFGKDTALALQCQPRSGNAGAGCGAAASYYKSRGRFTKEPEAGDQIFFTNGNEVSHTGIVAEVKDGKVYTIEGNSGDGVNRHSYKIGSEQIYGYGHPDWSLVKEEKEEKEEKEISGKEEKIPMKRNAIVVPTSTSTGETVNLRKSNSMSAKILAKVPFESPIIVTEDEGSWCRVTWEGVTGWMVSNYVEYTDMGDDEREDAGGLRLTAEEAMQLEAALAALDDVQTVIYSISEQIASVIGRG